MYYGFYYYRRFTNYNCIRERKTCNDIVTIASSGSLYSPLVVIIPIAARGFFVSLLSL